MQPEMQRSLSTAGEVKRAVANADLGGHAASEGGYPRGNPTKRA